MKKINKILLTIILGLFIAGGASAYISQYWNTLKDIIPRTDNQVDIGTSSKRIKSLYTHNLDVSNQFNLGGVVGAGGIDLNGNPLIIDADGNTQMIGDNNDVIDFDIGGTASVVQFSTSTQYFAGNVGIGTTAPDSKLSISGGKISIDQNHVGQTTFLKVRNTSGLGNDTADIDFAITPGTAIMGRIGVIRTNTGVSGASDMTFSTFGASDLVEAMRIDSTGNVGIGTTSPNNLLQVQGLINFNNTSYSTLLGYQAGHSLTDTGTYNTAIGYQALYTSATSTQNIAVGYKALYHNTTGYNNTANGMNALYSNTTGYNNTASGFQVLNHNTTGSYNTANGMDALYYNTTGSYNTANGYQSLFFNTTGSNNTANGYAALNHNTTGNNNTANGMYALISNTTGSSNTANGYIAGMYISDGTTGNATSTYSVYLGANTKANASGDTNEIVIGCGATGIGSNSVTLGNDSITTTALKGNVGIGTTNPQAKLDVAGNGYFDGNIYLSNDNDIAFSYPSQASLATGAIKWWDGGALQTSINHPAQYTISFNTNLIERMRIDASGNVGIGTTAPTGKLDIWKTAGSDALNVSSSTAGDLLTITDAGNVGIGTTTPDTLLSVDSQSATSTVTVGGTYPACLKLRDSDNAGWTYCTFLNGAMSCSTTPCN